MASVDLIANDPILAAMAKGDIPWGDLLVSRNEAMLLKTRKDIWMTFPVKLIPLGIDTDGAERHAVAWDYERLTSNMGQQELESSMRKRLLCALESSTKWVVESTRCTYCICIIRMVFHGYKPAKSPQLPSLQTIGDIYKFFPAVVCALNNGTHSIELHSKRIAKMSEIKGYDVSEEVRGELLCALKSSSSWCVLPTRLPCEVCRIKM
jgi:hypothetical protein